MRQDIAHTKASLAKGDLDILHKIIELQDVHILTVLEIGSWVGHSTALWQSMFDPLMLITIEKNYANYVKIPDNLYGTMKHRVYPLLGDSHDEAIITTVRELLSGEEGDTDRKVDFLFIDGDHSDQGVRQDWKDYKQFLADKAIVVFHDVDYVSEDAHAPVQVRDLWFDLKEGVITPAPYPYIEIRTKESTGMGVLFWGY